MKKLKQSYKEKTGLTIGVPPLHPAFSIQASGVVPSFRVQSCLTSSSISFVTGRAGEKKKRKKGKRSTLSLLWKNIMWLLFSPPKHILGRPIKRNKILGICFGSNINSLSLSCDGAERSTATERKREFAYFVLVMFSTCSSILLLDCLLSSVLHLAFVVSSPLLLAFVV